MKTQPRSGKNAYDMVAAFLIRNAKNIDNPDQAYEKFGKQLEQLVGTFAPAVDMMIRVYYNIEDFVADGEPMDQVWSDIENLSH